MTKEQIKTQAEMLLTGLEMDWAHMGQTKEGKYFIVLADGEEEYYEVDPLLVEYLLENGLISRERVQ